MAKIQNKFNGLTPEAERWLNDLAAQIVRKVFPKVIKPLIAPVRRDMAKALPDSSKTGSRKKQSASVKAAFPYKLNKQVRSKRVQDDLGVLQIIGVRKPEGNVVNFDFGDKAMAGGRNHILWGRRPKPQRLRKQIRNIPLEMEPKYAGPFRTAFIQEMKTAMAKETL